MSCDWICEQVIRKTRDGPKLFPLPGGEGPGEGERDTLFQRSANTLFKSRVLRFAMALREVAGRSHRHVIRQGDGKAALKAPQSRRFAQFGENVAVAKHLDRGGFSTVFAALPWAGWLAAHRGDFQTVAGPHSTSSPNEPLVPSLPARPTSRVHGSNPRGGPRLRLRGC